MNLVPDRKRPPTPEELAGGIEYCFQIGRGADASGQIFARQDVASLDDAAVARWHYKIEPRSDVRFPWLLRRFRADFVLMDHESRELLRICRQMWIPPRFDMIQNGAVVGTVALRTFLRNRYRIILRGGSTWTFHMPLFTICFRGHSSDHLRLWVQLGHSKREWYLLLQPQSDDLRLVAGLAFIHREWWCYS